MVVEAENEESRRRRAIILFLGIVLFLGAGIAGATVLLGDDGEEVPEALGLQETTTSTVGTTTTGGDGSSTSRPLAEGSATTPAPSTLAPSTAGRSTASQSTVPPGTAAPTPTAVPTSTPARNTTGPNASTPVRPSTTAPNTTGTTVYVVQPGDFLAGVAGRFGVTVDQILAVNNIANPNLIQPGQELVIPVPTGATTALPATSAPTATTAPPATTAPTATTPPTTAGTTIPPEALSPSTAPTTEQSDLKGEENLDPEPPAGITTVTAPPATVPTTLTPPEPTTTEAVPETTTTTEALPETTTTETTTTEAPAETTTTTEGTTGDGPTVGDPTTTESATTTTSTTTTTTVEETTTTEAVEETTTTEAVEETTTTTEAVEETTTTEAVPETTTTTEATTTTQSTTTTTIPRCNDNANPVKSTEDSGPCTLRKALADAQPGDVIKFDRSIAGKTITLETPLSHSVAADTELWIDGPFMGITIDGGGKTNLLEVGGAGNANWNRVILTNGKGGDTKGGAITVSGTVTLQLSNSEVVNNTTSGNGGGIRVAGGTLRTRNTNISGNTAKIGGGLWVGANAELENSAITGNTASAGPAGGLQATKDAVVSLRNVTVSGNSATASGGGIHTAGDTTIDRVTASANVGGNVHNVKDGKLRAMNSILANTDPKGEKAYKDCVQEGTLSTAVSSHNLIEDGSCTLGTDGRTGDPKLGALSRDEGGQRTAAQRPLPVLPLLAESPAIDTGSPLWCHGGTPNRFVTYDANGNLQYPWHASLFLTGGRGIMTDTDHSSFLTLKYREKRVRALGDRRPTRTPNHPTFIFEALFESGHVMEIMVSAREFTFERAEELAELHAFHAGQMPNLLTNNLNGITIVDGDKRFGGTDPMMIHAGTSVDNYGKLNVLPETMMHEAVHAELHAGVVAIPEWSQAEADDVTFATWYSSSDGTERVTENFHFWTANRFVGDRFADNLQLDGHDKIPHRMSFFDTQGFDMYPLTLRQTTRHWGVDQRVYTRGGPKSKCDIGAFEYQAKGTDYPVNFAPTAPQVDASVTAGPAQGTVLGTAAGSDPEGNTLRYLIGDDSEAPDAITIDETTGEITVKNGSVILPGDDGEVVIELIVMDDGTPGRSSTFELVIEVKAGNTTPYVADQTVRANPGAAATETVATATAVNAEAGETVTFAIQSVTNEGAAVTPAPFAINPSTGAITIAAGAAISEGTTFDVVVAASDSNATPATGTGTITLEMYSCSDPQVVTSSADSGPCTLRERVATTEPFSTITFAPELKGETIALQSPIKMDNGNTIDGTGNDITIDGRGQHRLFSIDNQLEAHFKGLTFTGGGNTSLGGAVYAGWASSLSFADCTFTKNASWHGGGAITQLGGDNTGYNSTLRVDNCTFEENGSQTGGAIQLYSNAWDAKITNSTFRKNNSWGQGGAIALANGQATIENSLFIDNTATNEGGAIAGIWGRDHATLNNVTVVGGESKNKQGSAVWASNALTINNSVLAPKTGTGKTACAVQAPADGATAPDRVVNNTHVNDGSCADTTTATALTSGDAKLNADGTPTEKSPFIDKGDTATCAVNDMLGKARVDGNDDGTVACDLGAIEYGGGSTNTAPTIPNLEATIDAGARPGTAVGTPAATDAQGDAIRYSIVDDSEAAGAFAVDEDTGAVTVADPTKVVRDADGKLTIKLKGTDQGIPKRATTFDVVVNVNANNFVPYFAPQTRNASPDAPVSTVITTIDAFNAEAGETVSYAITGVTSGGTAVDPSPFEIGSTSGELRRTTGGALTRDAVYEVTVSATDSNTTPATGTAVITLNAVECGELEVTRNTDSGNCSLRKIIADAPAGSTITFGDGVKDQTITITSTIDITKDVTLSGKDRGVTVDGQATHRIFNVADGTEEEAVDFSLVGLTLTKGKADAGPAVKVGARSTANLRDCVISENVGVGAIHVSGAAADGTDLTVQNCTFANNETAAAGAGIHVSGQNRIAVISDTTFSRNETTGNSGGAVHVTGSADARFSNAYFFRNKAKRNSAGIFSDGGTVSINSSTFLFQSSSFRPSAILTQGAGDFTMTNTFLRGLTDICTFNHSGATTMANNYLHAKTDNTCGSTGSTTGEDSSVNFTTAVPNAGSALIDAGDPATCTEFDRNGKARGDKCTIGAFEE